MEFFNKGFRQWGAVVSFLIPIVLIASIALNVYLLWPDESMADYSQEVKEYEMLEDSVGEQRVLSASLEKDYQNQIIDLKKQHKKQEISWNKERNQLQKEKLAIASITRDNIKLNNNILDTLTNEEMDKYLIDLIGK